MSGLVPCRFFFQQLIAGVHFCHKHGVSHRDLKLENTLLKHEVTQAGCAPIPVLKIADFGFCKHESLHTPPDSKVGTPAYISPVRPAHLPVPVLSPELIPLPTVSAAAAPTPCTPGTDRTGTHGNPPVLRTAGQPRALSAVNASEGRGAAPHACTLASHM